jgi:NADH-quinone oxidoreductase subunit C
VSTFALDQIASRFPEALAERYEDAAGDAWGVVKSEHLRDVVRHVKQDAALNFKLFVSIDAVDRLLLPQNDPRFEVVYFFYSVSRNEHLRLKVRATEQFPEIPSIVSIFQGANWWERFVWDFYGIRFTAHPDLKRILMYEEFKGHPLRKDYAMRDRQPLIPERPLRDIFRGPGTSGTA